MADHCRGRSFSHIDPPLHLSLSRTRRCRVMEEGGVQESDRGYLRYKNFTARVSQKCVVREYPALSDVHLRKKRQAPQSLWTHHMCEIVKRALFGAVGHFESADPTRLSK